MRVESYERYLVMRNAGGIVGEPYEDPQDALNEAVSHENTGGAYVLPVHVPYRSDDESATDAGKRASKSTTTTTRK